jgi:RNA polymerase sigma-70 factor (ECF subfamily)
MERAAAVDIVASNWDLTLGLPPLTSSAGSECRQRPIASWEGPFPSNRADSSAESDEVLMQRYQHGNEQAFHKLYERYRSSLLRFVKRLAPDAGETEEIAQETWIAVIQGRERYLPQARFVTYLFSIARRRTMDRWRRHGRSPQLEPEAAEPDCLAGPTRYEPESQANNAALRADLLLAIEALPILQREAFLLRAEGGLGIDEIAAVTGTNRETAKSRLRFALNRLRTALEAWA